MRNSYHVSLGMVFLLLIACCGCMTTLEATGEAVGVLGKAIWVGGKALGNVVYAGTSMAGQTAYQTNKTVSRPIKNYSVGTNVRLSKDKAVIPLLKEGNSYYVRVKINEQTWGKFLLDTGASALQISQAMARKLRIRIERAETVPVALAGGAMVAGRVVTLKKVRLGGAVVENVRAIVLENDQMDLREGLLGMSFLQNFVFQIDVEREELILQSRKP